MTFPTSPLLAKRSLTEVGTIVRGPAEATSKGQKVKEKATFYLPAYPRGPVNKIKGRYQQVVKQVNINNINKLVYTLMFTHGVNITPPHNPCAQSRGLNILSPDM